jgi:hypothetical protein
VTVYFNFYDADSLDTTVDSAYEYLQLIPDMAIGDFTDLVVGGYESYAIPYQFTSEDGTTYVGYVVATYVPENETGYVIDLEIAEIAQDEGFAYLDILLQSVWFFTPPQ